MLEKQRDRKRPVLEYRTFARNIVVVHFAVGLIVSTLLVFHELFFISIGVFLWYLLTIGLVAGMMRRLEWCRPLLGLLFLAFAAMAAIFITRIHPELEPVRPPMLNRGILPLWGAAVTLTYFTGGSLMLVSNRIKRATTLGFPLW
ncbi:MAG: hypothetical protein K1X78_25545 [Verrucomicrobiaceae bacterium]|nr:hypothetical protein [Verrucomicrobiaceae bacterium]